MLLDLFTLADSALPTGGYAFSNGLESAVQMGLLRTPADLDAYLQTAIHTTATSEIPFINACYNGDPIPANLTDILLAYDAMLTAPAIARASAMQGRNLLRLMRDLYVSKTMGRLHKTLLAQAVPAHYTIVLGATCRVAGLKRPHTCRVFMYQFLRDQISAAVRLGQIGPLEAARLQKRHHQTALAALAAIANADHTRASRSAPQWDIAQGMHEYLYSRLFQS